MQTQEDLMERMEETRLQKRPMLTDSKEFAIIRDIHFEHDILESKADRKERFERTKVNRNQSR